MKQSQKTLRTLGRYSILIGVLLLGFGLWEGFIDKELRDAMPNIIIAICVIGSGIVVLGQANKQD